MNTTFSELGIEESLIEKLKAAGISEPTAVQEKVIPMVMENRNMLFQSETGTGKTFAYLLPLIQKIEKEENPRKEVKLLVASPTYELASQIKSQVQLITGLKCALFIGGAPLNRQIDMLKEKPVIVIGGPSRLLELIHLKKLKVEGVETLVLDEADRLLSKELREDTEGLLDRLPVKVQLIGNSATVSKYTCEVLEKARKTEEDDSKQKKDKASNAENTADSSASSADTILPVEFVNLPPEDILRKKITHWAIFAERRDKIDTLRSFINAEKPEKLIVFTARTDQIDNIVSKLQYRKIDCMGMSSKTDKKDRKAAIDRFRSGKIRVLVTTDLVSRGLDIPGITHVVQMDLPETDDFFIHRAGRTARAGNTGINCVIGDESEMVRYSKLEKKLKITVYPKVLYGGKVLSPEEAEGTDGDQE